MVKIADITLGQIIHTDLNEPLDVTNKALHVYTPTGENVDLATFLTNFNAEDFASQTTLAAILAKIIAAPSTEAKQDTIKAVLDTLGTEATLSALNTAFGNEDFSSEVTLASVLTKLTELDNKIDAISNADNMNVQQVGSIESQYDKIVFGFGTAGQKIRIRIDQTGDSYVYFYSDNYLEQVQRKTDNIDFFHGFISNNLNRFMVAVDSALTTLSLGANNLTGIIPNELGNLTSLTILSLSAGSLTGIIPNELGNLTSLTALYLYSNSLTGEIPVELGNLTSLTTLNLSENSLIGNFLNTLNTQANLNDLQLQDNSLTQTNVDNILADLVDSLNLAGRVICTVDLSTNSAPTDLTDVNTLETAGWTVTVDP